MAVKAVLFDMDDTLYDHRFARLAGLRALQGAEAGLARVPLRELDSVYERLFTTGHASLVLTGRITLDSSRRSRMAAFLKEFGVAASRRRVQELVDLRLAEYYRRRRAVPGAPELLRALRSAGVPVGVVTNNLRTEQEEKLRFMRIGGYVDHLVCSEQVGVMKPHPKMFRLALRRLAVSADRAVMVGDSWDSDVRGAAPLGIWPIWFHRDLRPMPADPPAGELRSFRPLSRAFAAVTRSRPGGA